MDINIGAITEAINDKADRDAGNLTTEGKHNVNTLSFPSDRYIDLTLLASGNTYTAPANGYFCLVGVSAQQGAYTLQDVNSGLMVETKTGATSSVFLPSAKGRAVKAYYTSSVNYLRFIYSEGEPNV